MFFTCHASKTSIHSHLQKKNNKDCNGDSHLNEHNESNIKVYTDNSLFTRLTLFV